MDPYLSDSGALDGDNSTLPATCVALSYNSLNGTDVSLYVDVGVRAVNVVMAELILLLGNFLNILTLTLIVRYKELHNLSFAIAAQIVVCNIVEAITTNFAGVISNIFGRWILGAHACVLAAFLDFFCSTVRVVLYFIFSFDRFAVVFHPFCYPRRSVKIISVICIFTWSVTFICSLLPIPPLLDCYGFTDARFACFVVFECGKSCRVFFSMWAYLVGIPCTFISAGMFVVLYVKGRRIRKGESKLQHQSNKTISDSDWRALKTISLLFGSFLIVSFLPIILVFVRRHLQGIASHLVQSLITLLFDVVFILDPVIILRNADARLACEKFKVDIRHALSQFCK